MSRSATLGVALLALTLTLTACTSETSDGEATAEETTASEEPTQPDEATTSEAAPAADGDLASCLLGTWEMNQDSMLEQVTALMGEETMAGMEMEVTGTSSLTFEETSIAIESDSVATVTMDMSDAGGMVMESSSTTQGSAAVTYTLEGDVLTIDEVTSADGTVQVTVTAPGTDPVTTETPFADTLPLAVGTEQTVACQGDEMTMTASAEDITATATYQRR